MFEKVIFVPDPRTYRSRTIGVDDTAERLKRISIQLGSKSGKWVKCTATGNLDHSLI